MFCVVANFGFLLILCCLIEVCDYFHLILFLGLSRKNKFFGGSQDSSFQYGSEKKQKETSSREGTKEFQKKKTNNDTHVNAIGKYLDHLLHPFTCGGKCSILPDSYLSLIDKGERKSESATRKETVVKKSHSFIFGSEFSATELQQLKDQLEVASYAFKNEPQKNLDYRNALNLGNEHFCLSHALDINNEQMYPIIDWIRRILVPMHNVNAQLYKLNLYSENGFFKGHVDTPRDGKMFGTLVLCIPIDSFQGGELVVTHNGTKVVYDWASDISKAVVEQSNQKRKEKKKKKIGLELGGKKEVPGNTVVSKEKRQVYNEIHWCAFYGDCTHEILPVKSGNRLTITFNLIAIGPKIVPEHRSDKMDANNYEQFAKQGKVSPFYELQLQTLEMMQLKSITNKKEEQAALDKFTQQKEIQKIHEFSKIVHLGVEAKNNPSKSENGFENFRNCLIQALVDEFFLSDGGKLGVCLCKEIGLEVNILPVYYVDRSDIEDEETGEIKTISENDQLIQLKKFPEHASDQYIQRTEDDDEFRYGLYVDEEQKINSEGTKSHNSDFSPASRQRYHLLWCNDRINHAKVQTEVASASYGNEFSIDAEYVWAAIVIKIPSFEKENVRGIFGWSLINISFYP
ncbi:hypothetical protein RFI_34086 [Reticulomyxa filosa]|uniref:Fe2OG dioxygenase domain-containing protein n=1 Tax=Reticulomyxa filosa TaxID=46433 RepID=X6LRF7_RETFI|nr:hypothetical protein RFI_34086 [Reticulomyxa filosa]|eukprot:ETO03325.1 hypothetical protein RFI_34086 [Reticulomyxa filosa]